MWDHHETVDQIRAFVHSSELEPTGLPESVASTYAKACAEANERMDRCTRLLQQGLKSEAIQLAEAEPKLLDVITALDFPERGAWDELAQSSELPVAPKLALNQAQFLDEAYAQRYPLEHLLRKHRRLALQRAPLRSRIAVMRKLAAQDANNPIWLDDLRHFEKTRFAQIQCEAEMAVRSHDLNALSGLLGEIEKGPWVEAPPKGLIRLLRKANEDLARQQAKAHLVDLEARLQAAFAARDPIRGRMARQELYALTSAARLGRTDPIWDRVRSPLKWLEKEDRIHQANQAHGRDLAALVKALDNPGYIRPADLERLAHAVLQHGRGMSEANQQRYVARLRTAEAAQSRRWRAIAGGIAASAILAGSLTFYAIRSSNRATTASQTATEVVDAIERGLLEEADGIIKKLEQEDTGLLSYPPLLGAQQNLQTAHVNENDRIAAFNEACDKVEQAPISQVTPPDLENAHKLARLRTDTARLGRILDGREAIRNQNEKELGPRCDAVEQTIAEVERGVGTELNGKTDVSKVLAQLDDAQHKLNDLQPELAKVGIGAQNRLHSLDRRLETARTRFDQGQRKARLEQSITGTVAFSTTSGAGELVKFASKLDEYIKSFPDDPRSRNFRQTAEEQSLWSATEACNTLTASWKRRSIVLTTDEAEARAFQCGGFVATYPAYPGSQEIVRYQRHLEAIARRKPAKGSPIDKLRLLLAGPFVNHVWMITISEGIRGQKIVNHYYATKEPVERGAILEFRSVVADHRGELLQSIQRSRIIHRGLSPQSRIASQFIPILQNESLASEWETAMLKLIGAIVQSKDIDPILQVTLLRGVVESAIEGSQPLLESLSLFKQKLDQPTFDPKMRWMDPDTPDLKLHQAHAADLIRWLPDLAEAGKQARVLRDQIEQDVNRTCRTVGWLARNADAWDVRTGPVFPAQGDLWIVAYTHDKRGVWQQVGTINKGKMTIQPSDNSSLAEGRPVFVISGSLK